MVGLLCYVEQKEDVAQRGKPRRETSADEANHRIPRITEAGIAPRPQDRANLFGRAGQFVDSSKLRLAYCWKRLQMSMRPSIKNVRRSTI